MNKKQKLAKIKMMEKLVAEKKRLLEMKRLRQNPALGIHKLLEADLEQAEIILAIQAMEEEVQNMAEKVAKLKVEELMPIADRIREEMGLEKAEAFDNSVSETLDSLLDSLKQSRESMSQASLVLQGKADSAEMSDMANDDDEADADDLDLDMGDDDDDLFVGDDDGDEDNDLDDLFGGSDEASGDVDEPLGRAKKESFQHTRRMVESKKKTSRLNSKK